MYEVNKVRFGERRCNKNNCTTCPYIEDGRTQYTFNSTGQTNQIKSHITCEKSNVIYMIPCSKCNLQYIGETKRRLKDRFNEQRRPIINTSSYNPTAVSRHFITGLIRLIICFFYHLKNYILIVIQLERLVRHSSSTEETHWSLQVLTEKCNPTSFFLISIILYFRFYFIIIIFSVF